MTSTINGASALARGLPFLFKKGILRYTLIPFLINLVLFAAMLYFGWEYIDTLADKYIGSGKFLSFLGTSLKIFVMIVYLFAFSFIFGTIANLIASPFNGLLAEKIEQKITGKPITSSGFKQELKKLPATIASESSKLWYIGSRGLLLLIVSFIPVVNIISPVLWFMFGAKLQTLTYIDYPAANNNIRFKQTRKLLAKQRLSGMSFGMMVVLLTMLPIINFFIMPVAVAGATWLWSTNIKDKL